MRFIAQVIKKTHKTQKLLKAIMILIHLAMLLVKLARTSTNIMKTRVMKTNVKTAMQKNGIKTSVSKLMNTLV